MTNYAMGNDANDVKRPDKQESAAGKTPTGDIKVTRAFDTQSCAFAHMAPVSNQTDQPFRRWNITPFYSLLLIWCLRIGRSALVGETISP